LQDFGIPAIRYSETTWKIPEHMQPHWMQKWNFQSAGLFSFPKSAQTSFVGPKNSTLLANPNTYLAFKNPEKRLSHLCQD